MLGCLSYERNIHLSVRLFGKHVNSDKTKKNFAKFLNRIKGPFI